MGTNGEGRGSGWKGEVHMKGEGEGVGGWEGCGQGIYSRRED